MNQGIRISKKKISAIINRWFYSLGHTQGIVVKYDRVVSQYDITRLIEEIINPNIIKKRDKAIQKLLYNK